MKTDIAVVGAGLAGLYAAHQWALRGYQVVLVERKPEPGRPTHTTGIFVRRTVEDYPWLLPFLGRGIHRIELATPERIQLSLHNHQPEFWVADMHSLYKDLWQKAQAAGVKCMPGCRFQKLESCNEQVRIQLESQSQKYWLQAKMLVGADGPLSPVAQQSGLHRNRRFLVGIEKQGQLRQAGPAKLVCWLDANRAPGYIGWWVSDGQHAHLGCAGIQGCFQPRISLKAFEQLAQEIGLECPHEEIRGGLIPVSGIGTHLTRGRVILIGDATGAVSPLTAGGLDPALRLTDQAIHLVSQVLAGEQPDCRRYNHQNHLVFRRKQAMRWAFEWSQRLHLDVGLMRMMGLPILRIALNALFFAKASFPDPRPDKNMPQTIPTSPV
ncbi:MAG: NAD(P)/FAD-dependent oxidoreductase [Acidobacteria bacterium]|nr:NAD(P)/FAD-dependent oxidoreductase [Acidobacteriota bacterium]